MLMMADYGDDRVVNVLTMMGMSELVIEAKMLILVKIT